ncbi:E7 [Trichechus manatus latirostris papillomavirus 3]|uniref:Protein E7 n=1 Tax=Trichechus manatus latirostris papillomavirus 3 TaxID=2848316 RepID=A0A0F6TNK7_9PAPI|nr:E7 [Trichechus manatus latirostris papillomavirus 3]AKE50897.1 E7 [Trichechus manatus latirostris papillomavirus 3]
MIGTTTTLKDIVLSECPHPNSPVNLHCDEEANFDFERQVEEESQEPHYCSYRILVACPCCNRPVRLAVLCSGSGIYNLQELLFRDVQIICPLCIREQNF